MEMTDAIDHLANKLQVPIEQLMAVLATQCRITVICNISVCILLLIFVCTLATILYKKTRPELEYSDRWTFEDVVCVLCVLSLAVSTFFLIVGMFCTIYDAITFIYNPEYAALQKLLSLI